MCLVGHESYSNNEENMEVIIKSANVLLSTTLQVNFVRIILPHVYTGSYHRFWGKYFKFKWDFSVSCPNSQKMTSFVTLALGGSFYQRQENHLLGFETYSRVTLTKKIITLFKNNPNQTNKKPQPCCFIFTFVKILRGGNCPFIRQFFSNLYP